MILAQSESQGDETNPRRVSWQDRKPRPLPVLRANQTSLRGGQQEALNSPEMVGL